MIDDTYWSTIQQCNNYFLHTEVQNVEKHRDGYTGIEG